MNFNEDKILKEVEAYIAATYGQHYIGTNHDDSRPDRPLQVLDMWNAISNESEMVATLKNNAIKYLVRFGKKKGRNKKDLLKAIHYIILMWEFTEFDNT